jgi:DNA-binding NtrC family response regulator
MSLPALRERREDILVLAAHFLDKHARRHRPPPALSPSARAALLAFDWPGNVRELENAIIRAIGTRDADVLEAEDLGLPGAARAACGSAVQETEPRPFRTLKKLMLQAFERDYLVRLLGSHRGNVTHAARAAGTDRRDLGRLLQKHGLDPKRFAAPVADAGG